MCLSFCLSTGRGYPYPIMLCNITQNAMGQTPGGYPYPIMFCNITQNAMGQTPGGGYPARSSGGVSCQVRTGGGGTQLGQQKEYSLHGGRYVSCVHTGLSCVNKRSCYACVFYMLQGSLLNFNIFYVLV